MHISKRFLREYSLAWWTTGGTSEQSTKVFLCEISLFLKDNFSIVDVDSCCEYSCECLDCIEVCVCVCVSVSVCVCLRVYACVVRMCYV